MESELAQAWEDKADILIHPVAKNGQWFQFYHPDRFIRAGEETAREQIPEIKRLLVE